MNKIIVIEGVDATGKSTLASYLAEKLNGVVIHCTYNKDWDMQDYHATIMDVAIDLKNYMPVIIDRWAPSEEIYGTVYRSEPSYDTSMVIEDFADDITWIACQNKDAVKTHAKLKQERDEMFSDISEAAKAYDKYFKKTDKLLHWTYYDYSKVSLSDFYKQLKEPK